MKSFNKWLEENHPEYFNEGLRDYVTKFALPATAALGIGMATAPYDISSQNRPAAVSRMSGTIDNEKFISYAAQQVERQLGGSQDSRILKPKGWDELGEDLQDQIYKKAHDQLVQQYGVKNKDELQRMFNRETLQGRYDGSNPYRIKY